MTRRFCDACGKPATKNTAWAKVVGYEPLIAFSWKVDLCPTCLVAALEDAAKAWVMPALTPFMGRRTEGPPDDAAPLQAAGCSYTPGAHDRIESTLGPLPPSTGAGLDEPAPSPETPEKGGK